jgi:hypothetical protein
VEKQMELIKKIAKAKLEIKESKLKKEGTNNFSHYDYFTPSQVELLVNNVCKTNNLLTKFDLIRNELGVFGKLTVYDCDSSEKLEYEMATAIPEIKATNIVQQLGGAVTYTERYLKMSAFGITDNQLDLDADQKPEVKKEQSITPKIKDEKQWLSDSNCDIICKRIIAGEKDLLEKTKSIYKISKANYAKLEVATKN